MALHWLMAFMIVFMLGLGFYMHDLGDDSPSRFVLYQLHKSIGITIFMLAALRLIWRLLHRPKFRMPNLSAFERFSSKFVHGAFYFLMFALPTSGWILTSTAPFDLPTMWFGAVSVPHLPIVDEAVRARVHESSSDAHEVLAIVAVVLLSLHVLAALKHHYINKDAVLMRMVPMISRQWPGYFVVLFAALVALSWVLMSSDLVGSRVGTNSEPAPVIDETPAADVAGLRGADWPGTRFLDQNSGSLRFFWFQPDEPVPGEFNSFSLHINLDDQQPEHRLLDVDIAMDDLKIDDGEALTMLLGAEWFYAQMYPQARFRSTRIEVEEDAWRVWGNLDIRGNSQAVDFLLRISELDDDQQQIYGEFSLVRQEYGIGQGEWVSDEYVGSEVLVQFDITSSPGSLPATGADADDDSAGNSADESADESVDDAGQ